MLWCRAQPVQPLQVAGAMKKAGYAVESFKSEGGERGYRINKWRRARRAFLAPDVDRHSRAMLA